VDYGAVYEWKNRILPIAFDGLTRMTSTGLREKFESFTEENNHWLGDYALYRAIKASQGQKPWYEWTEPLKLRDAHEIACVSQELYSEILAEKFYQFLFFRQWQAVKIYANQNGVRVVGDVPIFVALDSSDVWRNQHLFK